MTTLRLFFHLIILLVLKEKKSLSIYLVILTLPSHGTTLYSLPIPLVHTALSSGLSRLSVCVYAWVYGSQCVCVCVCVCLYIKLSGVCLTARRVPLFHSHSLSLSRSHNWMKLRTITQHSLILVIIT